MGDLRLISKVAGRLKMGPGKVDPKLTEALSKVKKFRATSNGSLNESLMSAAFYAKKLGKTMYVYPGNSYGHGVWRVTFKMGELLDPINNTGERIASITPDLVGSWHEVERPNYGGDSET